MDNKKECKISQTLTLLLEKLPSIFLRISNSEVVNANKISHFAFTFDGKIKIYFKNGSFTYSIRSYLQEFKRYFWIMRTTKKYLNAVATSIAIECMVSVLFYKSIHCFLLATTIYSPSFAYSLFLNRYFFREYYLVI